MTYNDELTIDEELARDARRLTEAVDVLLDAIDQLHGGCRHLIGLDKIHAVNSARTALNYTLLTQWERMKR